MSLAMSKRLVISKLLLSSLWPDHFLGLLRWSVVQRSGMHDKLFDKLGPLLLYRQTRQLRIEPVVVSVSEREKLSSVVSAGF